MKAVERVGGRTGGRGQKAENPANRVKRMLQTANLDKGQWFAAGFMGDSSNTKIAIRSALPRSFVGKSLGARFLPGGAFEFRCIPGRGCGHPARLAREPGGLVRPLQQLAAP